MPRSVRWILLAVPWAGRYRGPMTARTAEDRRADRTPKLRQHRRRQHRVLALALPALVAGCVLGGGTDGATTVKLDDFPNLTVECRTEPAAATGECAGWAVSVLVELTDDVPRTDRLTLSGPMGPFQEPGACTAEFRGPFGDPVSSTSIDCWVPSGG